jgi:hypothetical protein
MNLMRVALRVLILSLLMLSVTHSADVVYAETLCVRVLTSRGPAVGPPISDHPAAGALVTLRGWTANTDQNGSFCFDGVSPGQYQIILEWQGNRSLCAVETSKQNICPVQ